MTNWKGISPEQLSEMAAETLQRWPTATLQKNNVGNLAVEVDGKFVGYLDLRHGGVQPW